MQSGLVEDFGAPEAAAFTGFVHLSTIVGVMLAWNFATLAVIGSITVYQVSTEEVLQACRAWPSWEGCSWPPRPRQRMIRRAQEELAATESASKVLPRARRKGAHLGDFLTPGAFDDSAGGHGPGARATAAAAV